MSNYKSAAQKAISLMDLTTLNDSDTDETIIQLCHNAKSPAGNTAAICVYPRFIPIARKTLKDIGAKHIRIATVTNFPHGNPDIAIAVTETKAAIAYGADEVDVTFPYKSLMAGEEQIGYELVKACKEACGDSAKLKVIIESGALKTPELIRKASELSIDAGADFLKTSTGKIPENATLEAAEVMLNVIHEKSDNVAFKASGGVRDAEMAGRYLTLATGIMGAEWITSDHFRFGASSLLPTLLKELELA